MRTLIVDDEPIARQVLREELEPFSYVEIVGEADNGKQALRKIEELDPDLVFLDLQMPVMGGFDVIRGLRGPHIPAVVIVTAFDRHAIEAFEAGAIDYLLKPVSEVRLKKAVERARVLRDRPAERAEGMAHLADVAGEPNPPKSRKIVGRVGQEYFLLDVNEVLAFQADGEIVWIIAAKQKFIATQSLRAIEARLKPYPFQRVHRNAIVNVNHVKKMSALSSQRWLLTLTNSQELIVSKRLAHNVRTMLQW